MDIKQDLARIDSMAPTQLHAPACGEGIAASPRMEQWRPTDKELLALKTLFGPLLVWRESKRVLVGDCLRMSGGDAGVLFLPVVSLCEGSSEGVMIRRAIEASKTKGEISYAVRAYVGMQLLPAIAQEAQSIAETKRKYPFMKAKPNTLLLAKLRKKIAILVNLPDRQTFDALRKKLEAMSPEDLAAVLCEGVDISAFRRKRGEGKALTTKGAGVSEGSESAELAAGSELATEHP